jgi:hypothetical protein
MNIEGGAYLRIELNNGDVNNFINAIQKICNEETKIAIKKYGLNEEEIELFKRLNSYFD